MDCPPLPTLSTLPQPYVVEREPELAVLQSILKNGGQHTQSGNTGTDAVSSSTTLPIGETVKRNGGKLRVIAPCDANKDSITKGVSYSTEFERQRINGFRDDAKAFFKSYYNTMREHNPTLYGQLTGPSFEVMLNEMDTWTGAVPTRDAEFYLITVNPKPTIVLGELMTFVEKMLNKKWIQDNNGYWLYAYEVRRPIDDPQYSEKGPGLHVHIILERPIIAGTSKRYPASAFKREIVSTFTKIVGNTHAVDFKAITDGTLHNTIAYVLGIKDDSKDFALDATEHYREEHNIENYYERDGHDRTTAIIDNTYPPDYSTTDQSTEEDERKSDSQSDDDSEDDNGDEEFVDG